MFVWLDEPSERLAPYRQHLPYQEWFERISQLTGISREAAFAIADHDVSGWTRRQVMEERKSWQEMIRRQNLAFLRFDLCSPDERRTVFTLFFPRLADEVERTWQLLSRIAVFREGLPWNPPFATDHEPEMSLTIKVSWLRSLAYLFADYPYEIDWVISHVEEFCDYRADWTIGLLLGANLHDASGSDTEIAAALRSLVVQTEDLGLLPRAFLIALLAGPPDIGWPVINRMLSDRSRCLFGYDSILSFAALTDRETFVLILRHIVELNLHDDFDISRQVSHWFYYVLQDNIANVDAALRLALRFIDDRSQLEAALDHEPADALYVALWVLGIFNLRILIDSVGRLLDDPSPERRLAAIAILRGVDLPEVDELLAPLVDDPDPRVAVQALSHLSLPVESKPDLFESILSLRDRSRAQADLPPLKLWSIEHSVSAHSYAYDLITHIGNRSPKLLLPYLRELVWHRMTWVAPMVWEAYRSDEEVRADFLQLVAVRIDVEFHTIIEFLEKQRLHSFEIHQLEELGRRRSLLRHYGIARLIAGQPEVIALDSADRLLASPSRIQQRLGLYVLWSLTEQHRELEACRDRVVRFAALRGRVYGRERALIRSIASGTTTRKRRNLLTPD